MVYMNTKTTTARGFHYNFKAHRAHRVHIAGGATITVQARSAREATDIATDAGHDVIMSARVR